VVAGHCESRQTGKGFALATAGFRLAAQVLSVLQGEGLCGKEAFRADLIFGSLYQDKEQSLRGN